MLSAADNDILCRVGPGTLMGNLLSEYWIPAFVSSELSVDGWPRKVRILGEDLIAFRDSQGRVGVVEENCPHRGSSMIFARNEDGGLLVMEWNPSRDPDVPRDYDDVEHLETARQPFGYKPDDEMIPWGNWRVKADVDNAWLRDHSLEKDKLYLGIYSNPLQDSAVQVTMGAIYDRTR